MDTAAPLIFWPDDRPEPDRRPVEIRPRRNMLLLRAGETSPRHCGQGELATVERHTLARIAPEDFEIVGSPSPPITDHRHP